MFSKTGNVEDIHITDVPAFLFLWTNCKVVLKNVALNTVLKAIATL